MQITARALRQLASDVDDMHHEAMRDFREEVADAHLDATRSPRRRFLQRAGLAGIGGAVLTAGGDTQIAGYAQSVELAAVGDNPLAGIEGAVLSA